MLFAGLKMKLRSGSLIFVEEKIENFLWSSENSQQTQNLHGFSSAKLGFINFIQKHKVPN